MIRTLIIAALLATGGTQVSAQSLVGKWDCDGRKDRGTAVRSLMDYRATGGFYHLANVASGDRRGRIDAAIVLRGTWQLRGNRLVEQIKTARMRSLDLNGKDIARTPFGRMMAKSLPRQMGAGRLDSVTNIRFVSPTKFKLTSGQTKATCTKR